MEFFLPIPLQGSDACKNWDYLLQRFKTFCQSCYGKQKHSGTNSAQIKSSLFLHLVGADLMKIVNAHISPESCPEHVVNNLLADIEHRCLPGFILLYERFKFFSRSQKNCEDITQFISELRWLSEYCELHEHKEKYTLGRIINGLHSDSLRKQLKDIESLDIEKVIGYCKGADVTNDRALPSQQFAAKKRGRKKTAVNMKENQLNSKPDKGETDQNSTIECCRQKERKPGKKKDISNNVSEENENEKSHEKSSVSLRSERASRQTRSSTRQQKMAFGKPEKCENSKNGIKSGSITSQPKSSSKPSATNFVSASPNLPAAADDTISKNSNDTLLLTYVPEEDVMAEICGKNAFIKQINKDKEFKFEYMEENDNGSKADVKDIPGNNNGDERTKTGQSESISKHTAIKKCPVCGRACGSTFLLKSHMRVHSRQRSYKCEGCDMSFIHSGTRSRHMRQVHPELLKHKCDECGMLFEVESALHLHILSHSKEENITCQDCGKVFTSTRDHYHHRRKEHKNTRYSCNICGLYFPYPSKLKIHHMTKHNATKPYMCEICGSSFAEKNLLTTHKNIHSGERKYECNKCGRRFLLKTTLNNHKLTHLEHKPHTCHICGLNFKLSYYLKSHMKTHSSNRERPHVCSTCGAAFYKAGQLRNHERKHTGEKPFKCEICNTPFSQLSSLNKHIKQIHEGVKPKNRFSCEFCGLSFTHSCKLKLHLMKHTGERPFQCKICGATYRENHQLTSHMKIHNGSEPFKCHICGRRFLQKSYLEGHVRRHTGEKPFKCPICHSGFTQKGYLRDHLKVHDENRERKYKCSVCDKAFTCSSHMRSHERLHTGEKPFKCDICNASFTKRSSVKKHLKRTHGIQDPDAHPIHESVSQGSQDATILSVTHTIPHQSAITISQLQPIEITHATIQTELQSTVMDMQNHSQLCTQTHQDMHVDLQAELTSSLGAALQSEMNSHLHSELGTEMDSELTHQLHPDISASLQAVHTSINQHMQQHDSIRITYPEIHPSLHTALHPQLHSQIQPVISSDMGTQMQQSEMIQEIQVYTMAS